MGLMVIIKKIKRKLIINKLKIGPNYKITDPFYIHHPELISIGENFFCQKDLRLEAFPSLDNSSPKILIGNNVNINWYVHIGAINKVIIGNNVLIGSRVLITDHSHGEISSVALTQPPNIRPIFSKGPVIIEDNVWIGEGACILSNVKIGRNSIIGANAVVTKDVPENCVAGGIPAQVIKKL